MPTDIELGLHLKTQKNSLGSILRHVESNPTVKRGMSSAEKQQLSSFYENCYSESDDHFSFMPASKMTGYSKMSLRAGSPGSGINTRFRLGSFTENTPTEYKTRITKKQTTDFKPVTKIIIEPNIQLRAPKQS